MRILVSGNEVDALSMILCHRDERRVARPQASCSKLRKEIPRHMFEVALQAAIGGKIVARENIKRAGQERDREVLRRRHHPQAEAAREAESGQEADEAMVGNVEIPQKAFLSVLGVQRD